MSEHPKEEVLAALADGESDPGASAHAASCPECRRALDAFRRTSALLASYAPASRNLCPPRSALFAHATFKGLEKRALDEHLAVCPLCKDDLADLAVLEAEPRPALAVRFARGLVELVENALGELAPRAEPALARGGERAEALAVRRELEPGVTLEVALAPGREGLDVLVCVKGAPRFRVELAREGRLIEGRESTDGRVLLDGVAPGEYELAVHRPQPPVVAVALSVRS